MKWYVYYSTGKYDELCAAVFEDVQQVEEFLSKYATNHEFTFRVIEGIERSFKPVQVSTKFVRA